MARTRKQDEQSQELWPVNGRDRSEAQAFTSPIESKPAPVDPWPGADGGALVEASAIVEVAAGNLTEFDSGPGQDPYSAGADAFRTYPEGIYPAGAHPAEAIAAEPYSSATAAEPYSSLPAHSYSYPEPDFDDSVLGELTYRTVAPREPVADARWAASLRRFGRAAVWCLPAAALAFALSAMWGWPTPDTGPSGAAPGTWLFVSLVGFGLWLAGVVALAAIVAATPVRTWGIVAVLASIAGTVLAAPVLGVLGLARPAVTRAADAIGADAASGLQAQFLGGAAGRWLAVGGFVLLGVGAVAVAGAILGSRVLNRPDGWLVLGAVGVAIGAAYLSWEFLLILAAMVLLAGTLGLAWTASRLTAEGGTTVID